MRLVIQTPTPDIDKSIRFYKTLNFEIQEHKSEVFAFDSKVIIRINPERTARVSIQLISSDWTAVKQASEIIPINDNHLVLDPNGIWVELIEKDTFIHTLNTNQSSILGAYNSISIETLNIEKSYTFWETLGFKASPIDFSKGWLSATSKNQDSVSFLKALQCPHLFFNPSLTYFNGTQNINIINEIKTRGVEVTEGITVFNTENIVDNIILRDPGGLGFFIFNDG